MIWFPAYVSEFPISLLLFGKDKDSKSNCYEVVLRKCSIVRVNSLAAITMVQVEPLES